MSKTPKAATHVGSASVLLIFTILSLISFATLTLVNSKADYNLSYNLAERQQQYYSACHEANAFIAAVNSGYETQSENGIIEKNIPITDNQSLDIALQSSENSGYSVIKWQIVNHGEYEYDYSLPVKQK